MVKPAQLTAYQGLLLHLHNITSPAGRAAASHCAHIRPGYTTYELKLLPANTEKTRLMDLINILPLVVVCCCEVASSNPGMCKAGLEQMTSATHRPNSDSGPYAGYLAVINMN